MFEANLLLTSASHAWICAAEQAQCVQPKVLVDETTRATCSRSPTDVLQPLMGRCSGGKNREKTFLVAKCHLEDLSRKVIGNTTES